MPAIERLPPGRGLRDRLNFTELIRQFQCSLSVKDPLKRGEAKVRKRRGGLILLFLLGLAALAVAVPLAFGAAHVVASY